MTSCAQQSLLTGGDKDIKAPVLNQEKTIPQNYSTNFNAKIIQLYFDEYVQLKDQKNNFFVNPTIEKIRLEEKGKSILIHLEEPLKEKTTYTFNFGTSIQDITENNPYTDFRYVLSTGSFIDSNFYRGSVYDAFTKKPLENVKVLLYEKKLDSLTEKTSPNYLCNTNEAGNFILNNLKEGEYYVMAIEDENKNNLPDPKNEKIAFNPNFINSLSPGDSTTIKDTLLLFMQDNPLKIIERNYTPPGKFNVLFNKKIATSDIKIDSINYFIQPRKFPSDTFSFWIDSIPNSPLSFQLTIENESFSKGLKINTFASTSKDSNFTFKAKNINNIKINQPLKLLFNHPIKKINYKKLHLLIDSAETDFIDSFDGALWSMLFPTISNTELTFMADPGAFESIYGQKNDTIELIFKQKENSLYGDLFLNIKCEACDQFIVHLINREALVTSFNCNEESLIDTIPLCNPGSYQLRLIHDLNGDGEWTTGDFNSKTQPEPVYYYNEPMVVKSGWSLDIKWVIQ